MTVKEFCARAADVWGLHDDGTKLKVLSCLQTRYYQLCQKAAFQELRNRKALTFAATETDGHWLPSDLIGITAVRSTTDGEEVLYHPTTEDRRYHLDGRYHWFFPSTQHDVLAESDHGLTVQPGYAQATLSAAAATWVGEYIQFKGWPGFYKIATVVAGTSFTFTPTFRGGQQIADGGYVVRPKGTKKIVIVDDEGELKADDVMVFYWQYPEPLYKDEQIILLPELNALELLVWADCIGSIEKRKTEADGYRSQAEDAMSDLTMRAPNNMTPGVPRNRLGARFVFGRSR